MQDSNFYLGRWADSQQPARYDPSDLTTHAVVIGMTGSGKTGLLIALLEEAARQGIPAIIVDPKGDLTNLLLHFPQLRPADFAPWIDPEAARRAGQSVDALAAETAERWRKGLLDWDLGPADLAGLRDAVDYTIYTPGSTAGTPVNLLSSFAAPSDWAANLETNRERIASTVTALLGLVGLSDVDPLRTREHILLANIFEHAWSRGQSLDLAALIEQVQTPPFERLGAFPLERFFPQKERFNLSLLLNNFLAAPSFQTWLEGQPLDAAQLLGDVGAPGQAARPRFSIFYLAHLSDNERMFFVTLLMAAVESWMRAQRGSSGLRALLAFDEITGYLPPVANPPSRPVLLRLLKQGRAFGLGLALATQNPTDLNYKALSNAGTWFIGRLQTEQDKQRLLDGLQALDTGGVDRASFDPLISALKPRLFLLHNIHQPGPRVLHSRWTLNYLAGPLTRAQLAALKPAPDQAARSGAAAAPAPVDAVPSAAVNSAAADRAAATDAQPKPRNAQYAASAAAGMPAAGLPAGGSPASPAAPSTPARKPRAVAVPAAPADALLDAPPALPDPLAPEPLYFPASVSLQRALAAQGGALRGPLEPQGLVYKPALLAQAEVRYLSRRYNLDYTRRVACLVPDPDAGPDWDTFDRPPLDPAALAAIRPAPDARYQPLPTVFATARGRSALQRDFLDWVYRTGTVYARANEPLKIYAGPDAPEELFRRQVETAAREGLQAEQESAAAAIDQKLDVLGRRIARQQRIVDRRSDAVGQRKNEQAATDLEFIASVFTRRKRSVSTSLTKRRLTQQARGELDEARKILTTLQAEWQALIDERQSTLQDLQDQWQARAAQVSRIPIPPQKKSLFPQIFTLAWLPYYRVKSPDGMIELAAF